MQAFCLSSEYSTALESPELPQMIVFLSKSTETQVEPLKESHLLLLDLPQTSVVPLLSEVIVNLVEGILHLLRYFVIHISYFVVVFVETISLELRLHVKRKHLLDVSRDMVSVHAVAIAYGEEV